ncbi:MAG: hypothetical protein Kow0089_22910 [Desulfobulbaceae bacterium]
MVGLCLLVFVLGVMASETVAEGIGGIQPREIAPGRPVLPDGFRRKPGVEELRPARHLFGEANDTLETAFPLDLNRGYQAAFHTADDVDYYRFTVPEGGLGSWVQVSAAVRNSREGVLKMYLLGGDGGSWEETGYGGEEKLWVAVTPGVTLYLAVVPDANQLRDMGASGLDYDLTLESAVLPDAATSMDEDAYQDATVGLQLDQPRWIYLAAVGDENGRERGSWDWFRYEEYRPCRNYCVTLSMAGVIVLRTPKGPSAAEGLRSRYCLNDNQARADGVPPLWVGISYEGAGDRSFLGTGDIPQRYRQSCSVLLTEEGEAVNDTGCER